uniref:LOB domain-containing protein n=1 Tax=Leersia perrieri TaxID=77586 RepID=A0A0D9X107_9ORYZ
MYEAAGRTINPVGGAVGLLSSGSWHLCQAAVETVLRGGGIGPMTDQLDAASLAARRGVGCSTFSTAKRSATRNTDAAAARVGQPSCDLGLWLSPGSPPAVAAGERRAGTPSMNSEGSVTTCGGAGGGEREEPELLNLFV